MSPSGTVDDPTHVVGAVGEIDDAARRRVIRAASRISGEQSGVAEVLHSDSAVLYGSSAVSRRRDSAGKAFAWTQAGALPKELTTVLRSWEQTARDADAAGVVLGEDGVIVVHGSVSGAQPLYVQVRGRIVFFATELDLLVASAEERLSPDWAAWAEILGMGAPLVGRTTFAGIRRVQPMEAVVLRPGQAPQQRQAPWSWAEVEPDPGVTPDQLTGEVLEALRTQLRPLLHEEDGAPRPVNPMLSGGRDSRLLTALAHELLTPEQEAAGPPDGHASRLTAWTTSSDTGTSLEELIAAQVANSLGVRQRIVAARYGRFAQDFRDYARAVDYQASYHVWLMPVAQQLAQVGGTVLDGLGGGVFLGGGFPDPPERTDDSASGRHAPGSDTPSAHSREWLLEARFSRMTRYLEDGPWVLAERVTGSITERAKADFAPQAEPFLDHPNGATLSAYLARTLPGISLAPARVLAGSRPTAMPIVSEPVVATALRVTHEAKRDGAWYPDLLRAADPRLRSVPTAADLTGPRQHLRRGASLGAAQFYRELILGSPVAQLVSDGMRTDDLAAWSRRLTKTKQQHLIRGLGMLALWLQEHEDRLTTTDPGELRHG